MTVDEKTNVTTVPVVVKHNGETPAKWDATTMVNEMQAEMYRLWRSAWFNLPTMLFPSNTTRAFRAPAGWAPTMDVFEKDGKLTVKADLPGMKKEDVEVSLDNGDLVLKGERRSEREATRGDYYFAERSYGQFYRRLPLAFDVDPKEIKAQFTDGVLEVTVPIKTTEPTKTQKIPVN
jgi:HSP20 family protein